MPVQHSNALEQTPELGDELLRCRMVVVGLFSGALERDDATAFEALRRNCLACADRAPCEADLRRDPVNPVWETYCPNAEEIKALLARTGAAG